VRVLFHHEPFDRDVSSGTEHAAHQWYDLLAGVGVTAAAVLNLSGDPWPHAISSDVAVEEFLAITEFQTAHAGEIVIATALGAPNNYRGYDYSGGDWLYIGGTTITGLPYSSAVSIPAVGGREFYPREAAAIILAEAML
jgi:hypothetical protein